jgi:hypothetical protein
MEADMDVDSSVYAIHVEIDEDFHKSSEGCNNDRWAWLCRLHAAAEKTFDDIKTSFGNRKQNCHSKVTSPGNVPTHIVVHPDSLWNTESTPNSDFGSNSIDDDEYIDDLDLDNYDTSIPTAVYDDEDDDADFDPHARLHTLLDNASSTSFFMAVIKPLLAGLLIGALAYGVGVTGGLILVYVWAAIMNRRRYVYGPVASRDSEDLGSWDEKTRYDDVCEKELV